jgi:hypothetical protein
MFNLAKNMTPYVITTTRAHIKHNAALQIHPPDAITNNLPPEKQYGMFNFERLAKFHTLISSLGPIDPGTVKLVAKEITVAEKERQRRLDSRPPLEECLNLHDFEVSTSCEYSNFTIP